MKKWFLSSSKFSIASAWISINFVCFASCPSSFSFSATKALTFLISSLSLNSGVSRSSTASIADGVVDICWVSRMVDSVDGEFTSAKATEMEVFGDMNDSSVRYWINDRFWGGLGWGFFKVVWSTQWRLSKRPNVKASTITRIDMQFFFFFCGWKCYVMKVLVCCDVMEVVSVVIW